MIRPEPGQLTVPTRTNQRALTAPAPASPTAIRGGSGPEPHRLPWLEHADRPDCPTLDAGAAAALRGHRARRGPPLPGPSGCRSRGVAVHNRRLDLPGAEALGPRGG